MYVFVCVGKVPDLVMGSKVHSKSFCDLTSHGLTCNVAFLLEGSGSMEIAHPFDVRFRTESETHNKSDPRQIGSYCEGSRRCINGVWVILKVYSLENALMFHLFLHSD